MKESVDQKDLHEEAASPGMSRSRFLQSAGLLAGSGVLLNWMGCRQPANHAGQPAGPAADTAGAMGAMGAKASYHPVRVAADPLKLPPPIHRSAPITQQITLTAKEVVGEIKPGVLFEYMTFNGQVPAPLLRVRQGDTIDLTLKGDAGNRHPHNIDFHSCYGSGGGADYLNVGPGQTRRIKFQVKDPGAFIYHCAVPDLDYHISSGMFGLILVEPKGGLPPVDQEYYFGQNEIYVKDPKNENTLAEFDFDALLSENPKYVVLNGAFNAITRQVYGSIQARQGQTARIYFVNGGPNLISSFHPIGNIWSRFWMQGSLSNDPFRLMQTVEINPGSCAILEIKYPVPEIVRLADHSITRTARKGLLAEIEVSGKPVPELFQAITS